MKIFIISLIAVLVASVSTSTSPARDDEDYADENDQQNTIDFDNLNEKHLHEVSDDLFDTNIYILFTRNNPTNGQILSMNNSKSIRSSNYNPKDQTVVLVHGWLGNRRTGMSRTIQDAYLKRQNTNIIILDWSNISITSYITAVVGVPKIGRALGRFLAFLKSETGASYNNMHLIGFSLGAHVVGNAGRELEGRLARVTGLDPAGPLWRTNRDRINSEAAQYVEGIHTNGGMLKTYGIGFAIGHVDFYPNGGYHQPGCLTAVCSHNRSWRLFASSITNDHFVGAKCFNYAQIMTNTCRGATLRMGNSKLQKNGSGKYRLSTGKTYPY